MREGPAHYAKLSPEPIDVIRSWELPWCIGNVVKYCARYRNKGGIKDLEKAKHYLELEIEALKVTDREQVAAKEREDGKRYWDAWNKRQLDGATILAADNYTVFNKHSYSGE